MAIPFPLSPIQFDPELSRAMIYNHPGSERIRWFAAMPDPSYKKKNALADTLDDKGKWMWFEQTKTRDFRAIVEEEKVVRRYLPQGEMWGGTIAVISMPDELPLGDHDLVIPIGIHDYGIPTLPDARTFTYKETLTRGGALFKQQGLLSCAGGTTIQGTGTKFTAMNAGDCLVVAQQSLRILTILSDSVLTVEAAPSPLWNKNAFSRGVEQLHWDTAFAVDSLYYGNSFVSATTVGIAEDGLTLTWPTPLQSPTPGTILSVAYRYFPKYIVVPELGDKGKVVNGVGMPQTVICRLFNPETQRRPGL